MSELAQVLRPLLPVDDPNALVDADTRDDAAVYLIAPDRALVVTVDFFTPVVDDGRDFGRIAAANALSDVYAMGGRPLFALNILGFPRKLLGSGVVEEILAGGSDVATEAGIPILGGHSVDDPEPKYGMVVVGEVDPSRMITNAGARPGDRLILTKPLGTGIISTAIKAGAADPEQIRSATEAMATLNRGAGELAAEDGVVAGTDITGYGLLGHLRNMLLQSGASATLVASDVQVLPGARELAHRGHIPGGTRRNMEDLSADVRFSPDVDPDTRVVLADAQTSGGLLLAVDPEKAEGLLAELRRESPASSIIGTVTAESPGVVTVEP